MSLELIIGIGITAFLLIYFAFQWDKEHFLLKLLVSFLFLGLLILMPKAIIDNPDTCDIVLNNTTICPYCCNWTNSTCSVNGSIENYDYTQYCVINIKNTHVIWYTVMLWFMRLFALYIFLYFFYVFWLKSKLIKFIGRGGK